MKPKIFLRFLTVLVLVNAGSPMDGALASGSFLIYPEETVPVPKAKPRPARQVRTTSKLHPTPPMPPPRPRERSRRDDVTEGTVSGTCTNCRRPPSVTAGREMVRVAGTAAGADRRTAVSFRTRGKPLGLSCRRQFVSSEGTYGPLGRKIAGLISSSAYSARYLHSHSLKAVCPKFGALDNAQKTKAWVWFWMVLANEESTCNVNLKHATHFPDGRRLNPKPGFGLYAAELHLQHRSWRGPMCRGNIRSADTQINCAVHTMADLQLRRGTGVLSSNSYWGPVRRYHRQILPNMRGFSACF